jgi:hypothetical protein
MGLTREEKLLRQLNTPQIQKFTPIATDLFLPNHSGVHQEVKVKNIPHAYGGFQNQVTTLNLTKDVWSKVTNVGNNLWVGVEGENMTLLNDTMIFNRGGDYFGMITVSISGGVNDDFFIRLYNVTQAKQEGYIIGATTTGAGNYNPITLPLYFEDIHVGDVFEVQMTNITNNDDVTLRSAVFYISYLHE